MSLLSKFELASFYKQTQSNWNFNANVHNCLNSRSILWSGGLIAIIIIIIITRKRSGAFCHLKPRFRQLFSALTNRSAPRTHIAPTYQISAKSNNPRLSYMSNLVAVGHHESDRTWILTIRQTPMTHSSPTYRILTESGKAWLELLMIQHIFDVRFKGPPTSQ